MSDENRKVIFEGLCRLQERVPYSKITISQICEEASVSRKMFYSHFENKNAIMTWHFDDILSKTLALIGREKTWLEGETEFCKMWMENRPLILDSFQDDSYDAVSAHSYHTSRDAYLKTVEEELKITPDIKLKFQINAITLLHSSLTYQWLQFEERETPEEFCLLLQTTIPEDLRELFDEHVLMKRERQDQGDDRLDELFGKHGMYRSNIRHPWH